MFDAPIGDGANTFIWIVVGIIAFVAAIMHVDVFQSFNKDKSEDKH